MLRDNKKKIFFGILISTLIISTIFLAGMIFRKGDRSPLDHIAVAISKGAEDNTGQPLKNIQTDDNTYYRVQGTDLGGGLLFLDRFDISGMEGSIISAILHVQYLTVTNYDREGYIQWALINGSFQNTTIQPHQTDDEVTETYNLFAEGVNTLAEIESLKIQFSNPGGWLFAPAIYFDYIWIEIGFESIE
ncbi:MAG: hypothetical protein HWN66_15580 [Candidatus Helarchaeota archaeon]|nr:hypothetical protein [Candidatus Helarchaeota archaeon]